MCEKNHGKTGKLAYASCNSVIKVMDSLEKAVTEGNEISYEMVTNHQLMT